MSRSSRTASRAAIAFLDSNALKEAAKSVAATLVSEADNQNGYAAIFSDGRMSLELELIDPESIAKAAIEAYSETAPLGRPKTKTQRTR